MSAFWAHPQTLHNIIADNIFTFTPAVLMIPPFLEAEMYNKIMAAALSFARLLPQSTAFPPTTAMGTRVCGISVSGIVRNPNLGRYNQHTRQTPASPDVLPHHVMAALTPSAERFGRLLLPSLYRYISLGDQENISCGISTSVQFSIWRLPLSARAGRLVTRRTASGVR